MCQVMNHYAADAGDFGSLCLLVVPLYLHRQTTVKEIMAVTQPVYVKGSILLKTCGCEIAYVSYSRCGYMLAR